MNLRAGCQKEPSRRLRGGGGAIHQTKTLPCKNTDPETAEKARYKLKSVEIKKSARRDKKELGDELAEEAETAAQKNDLKTLCN